MKPTALTASIMFHAAVVGALVWRYTPDAHPSADTEHAAVVSPPTALNRITPVYPRSARRKGREGCVALDVRVSPEGNVVDADIAALTSCQVFWTTILNDLSGRSICTQNRECLVNPCRIRTNAAVCLSRWQPYELLLRLYSSDKVAKS